MTRSAYQTAKMKFSRRLGKLVSEESLHGGKKWWRELSASTNKMEQRSTRAQIKNLKEQYNACMKKHRESGERGPITAFHAVCNSA